ncbi:diuretic hormone receptor-like [Dermacentor andersoni]|uniref:diuretic hormone receptor-like n=1 Tax=Dermacentor andersoni TaxID=34620 RepID=UPI002417A433|nr:diuretic hormone receptor-like [Dermacentor andersoni]
MEGGSGNAGGASWTESEHSAALDSLVAAIENFTIEHHGSGQPDAPFDESYLANLSLAQIRCYIAALNESQAYLLDDNGGPLTCHRTWDGLSCWPVTNAGAVATLPCFSFLNDLFYDTSNNATRTCLENGTWADRSDYSGCKPLVDVEREVDETTLYYIGYGVSLFALTIALWIFLYYKDLRCLRNTIHVNLMVTYFLVSIVWMTTATLQSIPSPVYRTGACFLYIVLTYLMGTNFFWMFVEGLYLYILVVKTFSVELVRIHVYAFVGWGLPALVVTIWAITKAYFSANRNDPALFDGLCTVAFKNKADMSQYFKLLLLPPKEKINATADSAPCFAKRNVALSLFSACLAAYIVEPLLSFSHPQFPNCSFCSCVWQLKDIYDCVFICPVAIVLLVNMFFMGEIMWVLITKLRATTTIETQQYRKAAKALLVLTPLLGVTYLLVIWTPSHKTAKIVFTYLQITLLSTQGFTVAVLYCFFNGEVRSTIRHHFQRWRTARALCAEQKRQGLNYRVACRRPSSCAISSVGAGTATHGDTGRLYKGRAPRSSCISFASTTSTVAPHAGYLGPAHRFSNGAFGPTGKDDAV